MKHPTRAQVIAHELIAMERRDSSRMATRLQLIHELDELGAARKLGFRSTPHWLSVECRLRPRTAQEYVRVAARLQVWTRVRDALAEGRLTWCQCRAITRADVEEDEQALIDVAVGSTVPALERHVKALRSAPSADLATVEAARGRAYVQFRDDESGMKHMWCSLAPEDGAWLEEAVETRAAQIFAPRQHPLLREKPRRPPLGVRRAQALMELLAGERPKATVILHADLASLAGEDGGRTLHLENGPSIPVELARRLTCDPMVTVKGLNHGRTLHGITWRQRKKLEDRDDRVCWMPGCDNTHGLHGHHIDHWALGGPTNIDHLVLLCPSHHPLFHEGGWKLRRRGDLLTVINNDGVEVMERYSPRIGNAYTRRHRRRGPTMTGTHTVPSGIRSVDVILRR